MSALFNQAARQERERFFWRLDSQWGKGLKQKTHPDRSPDFRVISKPKTAPLSLPRTTEARLHSDSQTLVTAHREPIGKTIDHVALGTFSDAPSAINPQYAGFAPELPKAPYRIVDGRKVWLP